MEATEAVMEENTRICSRALVLSKNFSSYKFSAFPRIPSLKLLSLLGAISHQIFGSYKLYLKAGGERQNSSHTHNTDTSETQRAAGVPDATCPKKSPCSRIV